MVLGSINSVIAEKDVVLPSGLSDLEKEIFIFVLDNWPATSLEIAEHFKEDLSDRVKKTRASTKYAYYLKKLISKKLLLSKKAGNSLIVWPLQIEKLRTVNSILSFQPRHMGDF